MPWVRGHYARSPRTGRRGEARLAFIVLAVLVAVFLIVMLARH
jgi:hypothetical protein